MNTEIRKLREDVELLKQQLDVAQRRLNNCVSSCKHQWSDPVADHIYEKGYEIPGDPPGTMGVDWRGPIWVEAKTIKQWKRTCSKCGEVQHTRKMAEHVTETPDFDV